MKVLFYYLIFPGFLFTAVAGMLASWVDRKVTARVQWRQGPPWYQNFADFVKLLGKEIIVPRTGKWIFLISPLLGLASVSIVATLLGRTLMNPSESFLGDLIVVIYLLTIPAIALILGASASSNPLASVGASREIKLVLSYELPFILAIAIVILKSGGLIRINDIINYQMINGPILGSVSGAIAFVAAILCMQAKLGFVPFDMAEADQELMGGTCIEYSGAPLAVFKLTKQMLLVVLPFFLISVFWANNLSILWVILKYAALLVVIILIKNTNPRVRIDQATRFFWGPMTVACIIGVILALIGY
ncbi:MAG: NADH-quinone oxidoreductase subunit H [Candidatus Omnitrophica bacterium]|nr:NADH-quinone oxidoreductase subunit H [Candidatus Omnitrophota bacterium]